jgi:DnaJ like chaperone protein
MSVWGKLIGGVAGFAMGGPVGALFGAALGHAADNGNLAGMKRALPFDSARLAAMLGRKDQLFAVNVTVLAAKLAKCDGVVSRAEVDAFKRQFRIEGAAVQQIGVLFDQARADAGGFVPYARQLGEAFADNRAILETVLSALSAVARADGPINGAEADFLARVAHEFGVDLDAAQRAGRAMSQNGADDPYEVLGVPRGLAADELRARWKQLMRENHPDGLAARGVPPEFIARATDRVARINAAYDQIRKERGI